MYCRHKTLEPSQRDIDLREQPKLGYKFRKDKVRSFMRVQSSKQFSIQIQIDEEQDAVFRTKT